MSQHVPISVEIGRNSNLLQRKWKNVFFFRHICNRFNMMHDGCIIFHIFFLLGLKFLQNKKFCIFDHFSTSYGASKSKNLGFCTKNGKTGFFSFLCKISLKLHIFLGDAPYLGAMGSQYVKNLFFSSL